MRAATVFNFLIESTLMGSVMILMMIAVRRFLRAQLSSRLLCVAWLLVAVRLLVPLTLPNPMMNELRPALSDNVGVRPIADQIRVRTSDAMGDLAFHLRHDAGTELAQKAGNVLQEFNAETSYGHTARWILLGYALIAISVLAYVVWQNVRFMRRIRRARVEELSGAEKEQYLALCRARGVRPVPAYWVDPLPSACLVGVFRPYIALPLALERTELMRVLAHELCHYRNGDHFWGLMRTACCVIHWFNPLVWLAARKSRADQELACDERVTAPMSDEERINYANTLALAAARRNAPEMTVMATGMTMKGREIKRRIRAIVDHRAAVRWLCIAALCVAGAGTLLSFCTAEALPKLAMPSVPHLEGDRIEKRSIHTQEDAVEYAREILASAPYLPSPSLTPYDSFDMLQWDALYVEKTGVWQVKTMPKTEMLGGVFELVFGEDGKIWLISDEWGGSEAYGTGRKANPTYRTDVKKREPLYEYARDYASYIIPDEELGDLYIGADYFAGSKRFVDVCTEGLYFHILVGEEPYICQFGRASSDYTDIYNSLYEANQQRRKQAMADAVKEAGEAADTQFFAMNEIEDGTALDAARDHAHNYLTEVYSYTVYDADQFVFGIQEIEGREWCVYFHPENPEARYMYALDDMHGTAFTPYRQTHVNAREGGLRYFLDVAWNEGWMVYWTESSRNAFADETLNELHEIHLTEETLQSIRDGSMDQESTLLCVFEAVYGEAELWNEALTDWYRKTLVHFGFRITV